MTSTDNSSAVPSQQQAGKTQGLPTNAWVGIRSNKFYIKQQEGINLTQEQTQLETTLPILSVSSMFPISHVPALKSNARLSAIYQEIETLVQPVYDDVQKICEPYGFQTALRVVDADKTASPMLTVSRHNKLINESSDELEATRKFHRLCLSVAQKLDTNVHMVFKSSYYKDMLDTYDVLEHEDTTTDVVHDIEYIQLRFSTIGDQVSDGKVSATVSGLLSVLNQLIETVKVKQNLIGE